MHICFITHEYPQPGVSQGGVGSFVHTIGQALVHQDVSVSVVGIYNIEHEENTIDRGIKVYRIPFSKWRLARFVPNTRALLNKLAEIHKHNPIDIIEGSELAFAFIPSSFPAKKVIRMHGGHNYFSTTLGNKPALWRSFQEKLSFSKVDGIAAVSDFVGSVTIKLLRLKKPVTTIYNLVDAQKFHEADSNKIIPGKLLFVGTVTEKKGVRQLVQAMPTIIQKFPHVTLDIIGRDWLDPKTGQAYTKYLKTFIQKDIENRINIIGSLPHDEIPVSLEQAEVCIYPSHMEAMPIAWLEALGMGKAVVASKTGPGKEAVKDGVTGLLCDPYRPDDIAEKIIYMLANPDKAAIMGKNARKDILNRFAMQKIIQQNIDFYESVL